MNVCDNQLVYFKHQVVKKTYIITIISFETNYKESMTLYLNSKDAVETFHDIIGQRTKEDKFRDKLNIKKVI